MTKAEKDEVSRRFNDWMSLTAHAAYQHTHTDEMSNEPGLFEGIAGCYRLARMCGPALLDFGEIGRKNVTSTYGGVCVIAYALKPPVDAKKWLEWICQARDEEKERRGKIRERLGT